MESINSILNKTCCFAPYMHYSDVIMSVLASQIKSINPWAFRLLGPPFVQTQIKETSKLCITGLCEGNPAITGGFPLQRASNAENISIMTGHNMMMPVGLFQYGISHLIIKSCNVLKTGIPCLEFSSYHLKIWQVPQQHCSWGIYQISKPKQHLRPTLWESYHGNIFRLDILLDIDTTPWFMMSRFMVRNPLLSQYLSTEPNTVRGRNGIPDWKWLHAYTKNISYILQNNHQHLW